MVEAGCTVCRGWGSPGPSPEEAAKTDCKSSFTPKASYFDVALWACRSCGSVWVQGYYEDFSHTPIEAEWGERHWIWRFITPARVAEISAASGSHRLDIDTF
jgi:hypothetical protein